MSLIVRVWVTVLILVAGAFLGGVSTVYHSVAFPTGLVVVVLVAGLFFAGVRLVSDSRWPTVVGIASYATTVASLAGEDAQGSVLVVADIAGLSFLALITLGAVVAIAWPKLSPRATRYDKGSDLVERTPPQ